MALISASGKGFLISDGVDLKFGKTGMAYARLPLVFKDAKKNPDGTWTSEKEILVEGTVFGKLAESLNEVVSGRTDLHVSGSLYLEEYEGKTRAKMLIHSAWPVKESRPGGSPAPATRDPEIPF